MSVELKKRILTSLVLLSLLLLMYFYSYIMIISLIVVAIITWIEFYALISKIILKNSLKDKIFRFLYKLVSLLYLSSLVFLILYIESFNTEFKVYLLFTVLVSILTDIGGFAFGKTFKGRKLTKISPKKTISGSIGSFIFALFLIPFFYDKLIKYEFITIVVFTILISLTSQLGDICISYLKRKANVKDTSDILPGHGGFLDRIDGMIFALPIGILLFKIF